MVIMKYEVKNLTQINNLINTGEPVLIFFTTEFCVVCKILKQKIFESFKKNFPKFNLCEIKIEENKEIAINFQVFSSPTILVYFDKKEFRREGRNISVELFVKELTRLYEMSTK